MISLRAHLVTLVAVFLALAVGVVLGGGPLSGPSDGATVASEPREQTEAAADSGDAFAAAVASRVLRNRLDDRTVAVVALPGADDEVLDALDGRIADAGGRVVGRYAITPTLLEPGEKQLVDSLGAQLVQQYAKGDVDRAAPPYERLGQLLALATASTDRAGDKVRSRSASVLASLTGADVAVAEGEPARRAPLVLVVLGDEPVDVVLAPEDRVSDDGVADDGLTGDGLTDAGSDVAATEAATDAVLAGLLDGLREGSTGVLLAGSAASGAGGALARLREDDGLARVATLDGVDTEVGRVSVPLALQQALEGSSGAFGASGSDGAVPLG